MKVDAPTNTSLSLYFGASPSDADEMRFIAPIKQGSDLYKCFVLKSMIPPIFLVYCNSVYCDTNWKAAGSIPDGVIGIFH
jgi:hypothetical protein